MEHFFESIDGFSSYQDQGILLETLLSHMPSSQNVRIAEIGVYKGRGTAMWNVILKNQGRTYEYYAIDHFQGSAEHDGSYDYYTEAIRNLQPILDDIHILRSTSLETAQRFPDHYFDIVYIDASHDYENVRDDILAWRPKVRPGGFLCGDDYVNGWDGVIRAVDEVIGKEHLRRVGNQQWWCVVI